MKYDFTAPLLDLMGNQLPVPGAADGDTTPWPMSDAISAALIAPPPAQISPDEGFRRWKIATDIRANPGAIDLDSRDVETVKACIAQIFGPIVVGPVIQLLESASAAPSRGQRGPRADKTG